MTVIPTISQDLDDGANLISLHWRSESGKGVCIIWTLGFDEAEWSHNFDGGYGVNASHFLLSAGLPDACKAKIRELS